MNPQSNFVLARAKKVNHLRKFRWISNILAGRILLPLVLRFERRQRGFQKRWHSPFKVRGNIGGSSRGAGGGIRAPVYQYRLPPRVTIIAQPVEVLEERKKIRQVYPDQERSWTYIFNTIWRFYYEISEEKYSRLVEGKTLAEEEGVKEPEFTLEKYLEEFIIANFDTIFKGKLKLFIDPEGNIGKQYPTDIGNIDILAEDPDTGPYVVIELKKGREPDTVVGQTLRYMGWVEENLCEEGQSVKGLVICRERDPRLTYALKVTPNVEVKFYKASFQLSSEPQA